MPIVMSIFFAMFFVFGNIGNDQYYTHLLDGI